MLRYVFSFTILSMMAACSSGNETKKTFETKQTATPTYEVATVQKAGVINTVTLPAQLAAYEEVSIFPKVNGYVQTVLVDIGSKVSKGQLLMTLEAPELEQAAAQAKEKYMQAQSDFALSKERYQRLLEASQTAGAISPFELSTARAKMQADSTLTNAEKTAWLMQQTVQGYLKVVAPFDGVITQRNVHPGALVSAIEKSNPMLELKSIAHLRLQVDVPEEIAAELNNKDSIAFTTSAMPGTVLKGVIARKAMNIESKLRAERVEIDVNNSDLKLSPGMYADVMIKTKGNAAAFTVPKSAVLTTTEGKYVLVDNNHELMKVNVSTGNTTTDKVEVFGTLQAGEKVITNPDEEATSKVQ